MVFGSISSIRVPSGHTNSLAVSRAKMAHRSRGALCRRCEIFPDRSHRAPCARHPGFGAASHPAPRRSGSSSEAPRLVSLDSLPGSDSVRYLLTKEARDQGHVIVADSMGTEANREVMEQGRAEPQLSTPSQAVVPPADLLPRTDDAPELQVSVHDSSRFEWQVGVPIPGAGTIPYSIETEFEIPSNALSGHSPWDLVQGFTRLDADLASVRTDGSVNSLRQKAVSLARMLDRARTGFARHCHEAIAQSRCEEPSDAQGFLMVWLDAALSAVSSSREQLAVTL